MTEIEERLLTLLGTASPRSADELCGATGLPRQKVATALHELWGRRIIKRHLDMRPGPRGMQRVTVYVKIEGHPCALQEAWTKAPEDYLQDMLDRL